MSLRLLLIEDDPISQEVIRSLLVGQGHLVEVAADGFGALEKLASASFDAALVDYHLPEMDGFALGRLIRDERRCQGRPPVLIGLTADRNGLAARRGSDAVFRAILPKPVEPAELFATLDRLLSPVEAPVVPPVVVGEAGAASPTLLWRGHGLPHAPRAFVAPAPLPDQAEALSLCFDLAPSAEAEIVLLIERHGIGQALAAARPGTGKALPIVGVSRDLADLCDLIFDVGDPEAWSCLAACLGAVPMTEAPAAPMPVPVLAREAPVEAAVPADELSVTELATMLRDGVSRPLDAAAAALDTADAESARESLWAARRALGIVTGCLAGTERGRGTAVFEPRLVVGRAMERVGAAAHASGLSIGLRVDPATPRQVDADASLFEELVSVLLDDACARWRQGTVTLYVGFSGEVNRLAARLVVDSAERGGEGHELLARLAELRTGLFRSSVALAGGEVLRREPPDVLPGGFALPALEVDAAGSPEPGDGVECAVVPVDDDKRDALSGAIGAAAVKRLSLHLLADVERLSETELPGRLSRLAELAACAAMLGMTELSELCGRAEAAPEADAVAAIRSGVVRARGALCLEEAAA